MARRDLLVLATCAALPLPASAGITVLGSTAARLCYLAADAPNRPRMEDLSWCNAALGEAQTSRRDRTATYVNRGILRLRRDEIDAAVADFDAAIRLDPTEAEAYINRGSALLRRDQPDLAVTMFSRALQNDTRRPELAHFGRGVAHELLGDARAAYNDYRRASEINPDWQAPRDNLRRFRIVPRSEVGSS